MDQYLPLVDLASLKAVYPFTSRYCLRPDGLALHYVDEGQGPPVVMVHGNPTWSFMYRELIGRLKSGWRCLAFDQMGLGLSSRPPEDRYSYRLAERIDDLELLVDHWRPNQPLHLIVHDWGGPVGLGWAVRNPGRVASITVINSSAFTPRGSESRLPWRLKLAYHAGPLAGLLVRKANLFLRGALATCTTSRLPDPVRRGYLAPYQNEADRLAILKFVQDIPLGPSHPSYAALEEVEKGLARFKDRPALLIWALKDAVFKADFLTRWQKVWPRAQALVLARAGHWALEDEPRLIYERLKDFLTRQPGRRNDG